MRSLALTMVALCCACTSQDSELKSSPDTCSPGTKRCGSACVATDLPAYGCAADACDSCPSIPHGAALCVAGGCSKACEADWGDCDQKPENGCEVDLRGTATDCGSCGKSCAAVHADSSCEAGACVVKSCEEPWKDCNAEASDGCEANPQDSPSHCGVCGHACETGEVCVKGECVKNADVLAWLETQKGGWCLDDYKKLVNLCGKISVCHYTLCGDLDTDPAGSPSCYDDYQHEHEKAVPFCCDTRFLKAYPNGIAIDVGFHYDGASTGSVFELGGDAASGRITLTFDSAGRLSGKVEGGGIVEAEVPRGTHLVSLYATTTRTALYVNGLLADEAGGSASDIVLLTEKGPGMVLGSRMSYWWEHPGTTLRFAPFLFHLRDGAPAGDWSLQAATGQTASSLLLFGTQGISGNAWTAAVGPQTAYAVPQDSADPDPQWVFEVLGKCF